MIKAVQIARYRGIRELVVPDLGRVNLIIGKNDAGKTALMEALRIAEDPEHAAHHLAQTQRDRLGRAAKVPIFDFDRFWRPVFFALDAAQGLSIAARDHDNGSWRTLDVRLGEVPEEILSTRYLSTPDAFEVDGGDIVDRRAWRLDLVLRIGDKPAGQQQVLATHAQLRMPPASSARGGSAWITSSAGLGAITVKYVSELKQRGLDGELLDLLRDVDPRVAGIELLAPGGDVPELYVRTGERVPLLPLSSMGDGFQRCLELGAAAAAHGWPILFIDEIENGLHHLVLEPLWRWISTISRLRDLQVFATTHSEECIHAATRAFGALDDDGLRVIRIDRGDDGTRAAVYDRALVDAAARTDVEIRG